MGAMTLAALFFGFISYSQPPLPITVLLAMSVVVYVLDNQTPQKLTLAFVVSIWAFCLLLEAIRNNSLITF